MGPDEETGGPGEIDNPSQRSGARGCPEVGEDTPCTTIVASLRARTYRKAQGAWLRECPQMSRHGRECLVHPGDRVPEFRGGFPRASAAERCGRGGSSRWLCARAGALKRVIEGLLFSSVVFFEPGSKFTIGLLKIALTAVRAGAPPRPFFPPR